MGTIIKETNVFDPDSGIHCLRISHPEKRNALTLAMWESLAVHLEDLSKEDGLKALILMGEGEDFSAGADISQFSEHRNPGNRANYQAALEHAGKALSSLLVPTFAQIRGLCFGGGLWLALQCDFRLADSTARFSLPAAKRGLSYGLEGIRLLVKLVGEPKAKEILFTGNEYSLSEALQAGLVHWEMHEPAEAERLIKQVTENAPLALHSLKAGFQEASGEKKEPYHAWWVERCFASQDYLEATTAFLEKRKPKFTGK